MKEHPITPPDGLVEKWSPSIAIDQATAKNFKVLATQAARWGADMELEACCEWMRQSYQDGFTADLLRSARRPKPPSLKERGREALQNIHAAVVMETGGRELDVLQEIVESLPD